MLIPQYGSLFINEQWTPHTGESVWPARVNRARMAKAACRWL